MIITALIFIGLVFTILDCWKRIRKKTNNNAFKLGIWGCYGIMAVIIIFCTLESLPAGTMTAGISVPFWVCSVLSWSLTLIGGSGILANIACFVILAEFLDKNFQKDKLQIQDIKK